MQAVEIRKRFLDFFSQRGHAVIPSAPLVTTDDAQVTDATLFNTAGMQPLIPYLLGAQHPHGRRLASSQKCLRTVDIAEVGDSTHLTFFEMLGNWSLGDYFKEEAILWSYTFLTSNDEGLGLDPNRLYVTVFAGNDRVPKDTEAIEIWKQFVPEHRIYERDSKDNWWTAGANSPAGPSTEMFYDVVGTLGDLTPSEFAHADDAQQVVEIWNDVFMTYRQENGIVVGELPQKNVDTGAGLERVATVVQGKQSVYETDLFLPLLAVIREHAVNYEERKARIIADHTKAAAMLFSDGVLPSNTDRGYILRRLVRRAVFLSDTIGFDAEHFDGLITVIGTMYRDVYPEIAREEISTLFREEEQRFRQTLKRGLREFEKGERDAFTLFTTYGFPLELTQELAANSGEEIDIAAFEKRMAAHQEQSRTAAAGKFKGGLAGHSPKEIQYHTATHLLHQALREVLGNHVLQRGSNITPERLRFDFSHPEKLSDEEIKRVEVMVNEKIAEGLPVWKETLSLDEAKRQGALGIFDEKYEDTVTVYHIGTGADQFSVEICGGPHVQNTNELGSFSIVKESASSKGVRRIKAVLQ